MIAETELKRKDAKIAKKKISCSWFSVLGSWFLVTTRLAGTTREPGAENSEHVFFASFASLRFNSFCFSKGAKAVSNAAAVQS
jgi:hypothetical protein